MFCKLAPPNKCRKKALGLQKPFKLLHLPTYILKQFPPFSFYTVSLPHTFLSVKISIFLFTLSSLTTEIPETTTVVGHLSVDPKPLDCSRSVC